MTGIYTHVIRIPGIPNPLYLVADSNEAAQQAACEALGLTFLPDGTVTTTTEASACSSAT